MSFIHLRLHSEYSIVDGITRLDAAVSAAALDGQPALAITDLGNTFGFIKFYNAARAQGVKPLLGVDAWMAASDARDPPCRVLLLAQNLQGYRNLCTLVSRAWLTNAHKDRGEIAFAWFAENSELSQSGASPGLLSDGLICLSGGRYGPIGQLLLRRSGQAIEQAEQWARQYQSVFGDRFYLEVHRAGFDDDELLIRQTIGLAVRADIAVVATHPIQFLKPEDFRSHEAKVCIARGETLADPRRSRDFTAEQYLKSQQQMESLFADIPAAIQNTVHIAQRCNLTLQLGTPQLPDFPTPNSESLDIYLRQASQDGLGIRLAQRFSDPVVRAQRAPEYEARLALECDTIIQMGFPGYFLIVADFINWAKSHGVPVGPGRGSGAGSLVAYCLGITDLDPLPYALLFERFLNPERVSMPDFDIDFCQEKRQKVIDYVRARYGSQAVSQIVTFGTMASRAVIRDAGRVLDLPYNFCDQLSKLIPVIQNKPLSLREAREKEPILAEREKKEDEVRELLAVAGPLEDLVRNVGMHAGGVLIAPGRLTDFCSLYQAPGSAGEDGIVSMYDKDDVEAAGLVKFDFLGLKNLTIIQAAVDTINRLYKDNLPYRPVVNDAQAAQGPLVLEALNGFDDPAAYQVLKEANTTGIFQVESQGMRRYLVKLAPDHFEDIIAMLALYRPGPLNSGMVDDFILRKRGQQKIDYFHPDLKDCLAPTYGVIVYQEQVMQIAQIIAGYSLGGADLLRRAMGKKKPEEMAQQRSIFLEGAKKKGHSEALATQLFDLMEKFAEYGFNKSHTAAYAVITYQTAWLKAHYPAEFMAATLSGDLDDTDKVAFLVADAKANGLAVLAPDINASQYRFEPEAGVKAIRYGLGAIRGVGESAVLSIVKARAEDPFKDLFDFCSRVDRRVVNKRAMEALVKAGAFDAIHPEGSRGRSQWLAGIALAVQAADDAQNSAHQGGLFDGQGSDAHADFSVIALAAVPAFSLRQMLLEEKLALGFCFSASLFDDVREEMRRWASSPLSRLQPTKDPIWMAGVVVDSRAQMTRRGMMRVVVIDDGSARLEVTVFNELYDSRRHVLRVDEPLLIQARVENDEYSGGLRGAATEVLTLPEARMRYAKGVRLTLSLEAHEAVDRLIQTLQSASSAPPSVGPASADATGRGCPIFVQLVGAHEACELALGEQWRIVPSDERLFEIRQAVAQAEVVLVYPEDTADR